jgi:asparagine synthase (glutamine-hydrolysing)
VCGLTFLYAPELPSPLILKQTQQALGRMVYRGPDEDGEIVGDGWAIGHRRLSIIDLQSSRQPMVCPEQRFYLAYNGEVYNYAELRAQLSTNWVFRTAGDTEVVLAGLVLHGPSFLEKMEGMWALALWDSHSQRLLLSRDRMGKKPLYYRIAGSRLACASELPALAVLDGCSWEEDLDSTADYLRYGYYLPGTTAYSGVREVLPGHWLQWSPGRELRTERYWSLSVGGFAGSRVDAQRELRECLECAIDRRLVADVEVGAFLSGGVDSSLMVALQTRRKGGPPKTFTIGFQEGSYDERQHARLIAARYETDHHEEVLGDWDPEQLRRLILEHVGQPFADPSILPTALVSRLAARHVKVALSGDGGDELFSGYQRYQAHSILRWYMRLPGSVRQPTERLLRHLPEPDSHHSRSLLKKMHLFLDTVKRVDAETPYIAPVMYSRDHMHVLAPETAGRGHPAPGLPPVCELDDIHRMMAADALVYLPQDILLKVDRASMAHSLEARAPFLDRNVVELAFRLPRKWHRHGFSGKRMLHASLSDLLPPSIWKRRKQGFGVPVGRWLKGELSTELLRLADATQTVLNSTEIERMIKAHRQGRRDYGLRLWQLYAYLLWREQFSSGSR